MCLIFLFFIFVQIFVEAKYNPINQILHIIKDCSLFEMEDKNDIINVKENNLVIADSKEMLEIKNLFEYLVKAMLFKINFEQNENSLNKNVKKLEKNKNNVGSQITPKYNDEKINQGKITIKIIMRI